MKVIIIHQHFKTPTTGGAIRSYYLAKSLIEAGIKVAVITTSNIGFKKETYEGIEVHYLPITYTNTFRFYARVFSFLRFMVSSAIYSHKIKEVDYCYAISVPPTVGLVAIYLKLTRKIPFLFEVGDLWPEAPIQMGFVKNYFLTRFLFAVEKIIYQSAKAIVALSPAIKLDIEKKVPAKKIHLIPNFADCDFYVPSSKNISLLTTFQVNAKFIVSYIGTLGLANGLEYFLECAKASQNAQLPIHFFLCGEGALHELLISNSQQLGLKNLTFLGFQNRKGVREIMHVTDAAFICYKKLPVLETGSPNKFFDALAAGKMIILNFDGWIKTEVENNRCGIFVDPHQPNDFVKKIADFVNNESILKKYQQAARQLAEKKYSRKKLSDQFVRLFITTEVIPPQHIPADNFMPDDKVSYGGLPDVDLKKNLGCG